MFVIYNRDDDKFFTFQKGDQFLFAEFRMSGRRIFGTFQTSESRGNWLNGIVDEAFEEIKRAWAHGSVKTEMRDTLSRTR